MRKTVCLFAAALVIGGCSKGLIFNPYTSEVFQPRRSLNEVLVLFDNPNVAFKTIGFIDFDFYQPGWSPPTLSDALPTLRKKVLNVGGDAVIVRSTTIVEGGFSRNLRIVADVIRYEP